MKKNKTIALLAGLSLAFVSSAALAAPSADTLLVAGYDSDQMAVLYGVSSTDVGDDMVTLDCTLEGEFIYTVKNATDDGLADVDTLEGDDTQFEAVSGDTPDPVTYNKLYESEDDAGKDCLLTSVLIERKGDGEVNHGTVVSTFAHLLGGGKGCIMRHFSQTNWGKSDPDVDGTSVVSADADPDFDVLLSSFASSCKNQRDRILGVDDDSTSGETTKARGPQKEQKDKPNKGKSTPPGQKNK